ncbi:restriction endonuclease subunit S [Clostridium perfringens]|uniref:restriction endonuclease subunit S n=1 Tax=Clostridium perfringens TaxID=1502 RepID=UPI0024BCE836|nr:restriction endonuclease subunit S [Clostridium perfringens]MDM0612665.1 restriction endonuclease subunit S [Clostridium perfringens]
MDTKVLKDKILQLAIQGKLVPQNENDEPASVLLERIKKEKEQLIKDRIIKKEKVLYTVSNDEKPFELPNIWEWCRLGSICKQITDGAHKTPKYIDSGIPFLSVKDISRGYIDFSDTKYISEEEHNSLISRCNPQRNDLLFCRIGTLGRFKVIDIDTEFSIFVSLGLIKLSNNIYPKYMEYVLNSPELYNQYYKIKVDGSHTSKLNLRDIPNLKIPLPPLEEQKRIVSKVDSLFKLIDELDSNKQDLLQNISDARNKVLQLAIKGKLVPQNENDESASVLLEKIKEKKEQLIKDKVIKKEKSLPDTTEEDKLFDIPNRWEWCRLGEIGQIIGGGTPSSGNEEYYSDNGIPWLTPADLRGYGDKYIANGSRYITELGLQKSSARMLPRGSVLFSSRAPIGYVVINSEELCTNQGFKSIVPYVSEMNEYIYYFLKYNTKNIEDMASGTTFKEISGKGMSEVVIPIPPLEEQKRIVAKVDAIMNYLDILEKEIK